MFLRKIFIDEYKILENISINFEKTSPNNIFPIISLNGGGKSTLLQFIFTFLHCPFRENRFEYIRNFLQVLPIPNNDNNATRIAKFEIEHENQLIELEFYYASKVYKKLNFDAILELKELKNQKNKNTELVENISILNKLENDIQNSQLSDASIRRELSRFTRASHEDEVLLRTAINKTSFIDIINKYKKRFESLLLGDDEFNVLTIKAEAEQNKLKEALEAENLSYALHFNNNQNILLYKSNVKIEILAELSDKIYLASPNTQVLQFLSDKELSRLFDNEKYTYSTYENAVKECQKNLTGLFTYEFSIISSIIGAFQKAIAEDTAQVVETGNYGNAIKKTTEELNNFFADKTISVDKNFKSVSFKRKDSKINLTPKDLSHGELKKLSIYIWLKNKPNNDAIILMDEVDMGLHPTWQHELADNLQEWSFGSQYLLATHSPQIISTAHYKNLVVLTKINETATNSTSEQFNESPLDSDLNTIVKTIMGGEYVPKKLQILRKKYRVFVDTNNLESEEAQSLKQQLLEYESENSSFFQEIKFELAFRQ
jgi:predicted ATPase